MNHCEVNVICHHADNGQALVMDETPGQTWWQKIKREQDGRAQRDMEWGRGDGSVCVNDMVICTQWSSDVIKAMI